MRCPDGSKCANWLKKCEICSCNPRYGNYFVPEGECKTCANLDEYGCLNELTGVCHYEKIVSPKETEKK